MRKIRRIKWFSRALAIAVTGAMLMGLTSTAMAQRHRVVVIQRVPVVDPFFWGPYPYAYPTNYVNDNYGYVKVDTHRKDATVYVDGGFAG